jgi:hypothetical protein
MANEKEMLNALETNTEVNVDPWDLAAAAAALLKLLPQFEQNKEEYKKFIKKVTEEVQSEEECESFNFLASIPCPCDPTGTGCHHASCPIGRADAAEHRVTQLENELAVVLKELHRREDYITNEVERARQLETANPIATRDVLERVMKQMKKVTEE